MKKSEKVLFGVFAFLFLAIIGGGVNGVGRAGAPSH